MTLAVSSVACETADIRGELLDASYIYPSLMSRGVVARKKGKRRVFRLTAMIHFT